MCLFAHISKLSSYEWGITDSYTFFRQMVIQCTCINAIQTILHIIRCLDIIITALVGFSDSVTINFSAIRQAFINNRHRRCKNFLNGQFVFLCGVLYTILFILHLPNTYISRVRNGKNKCWARVYISNSNWPAAFAYIQSKYIILTMWYKTFITKFARKLY